MKKDINLSEEVEVIDGEWVEADEAVKKVSELEAEPNAEVTAHVQLDTLIKRYIGDIDKLKKQLNEQRTMHKDIYENDAAYHDSEEKAKELNKAKQVIKKKITEQPAAIAVADKVKDLREEIKGAQEMLSGYLEQYVTKTGARTIEDNNGDIRQIVPNYKLVKENKQQ